MSALTVSIDRCRSAIHLRKDAPGERARLVRLHRAALGEPLALALEAAGLREDQPVCVRRLEVSLRVRRGATDSTIVQRLADEVAQALARARERGDVVAYGSRAHAVADLVRRTAAGDATRVWAWRQLGLWEDAAPEAGSASLLALLGEPAAIVPILAELAEAPTLLRRFADAIGRAGWRALARAALRVAGAPPELAEPAPQGGGAAPGAVGLTAASSAVLSAPERERVAAILSGARLGRALARLTPHGAGPTAEQAAVLALLAGDPACLSIAARPAAVVRTAAAVLAAAPGVRTEAAPASASSTAARPRAELGTASPNAARPSRAAADAGRAEPTSAPSGGADAPPSARTDASPDALPAAHGGDTPEIQDGRARGVTAHAGLLFLLHLVPEVVLPRTRDAAALAARPLRWTLHRLALALLPDLGPADPAALAFAGLVPGSPLPDADARPVTAAEAAELPELARATRIALAQRLGRPRRDAEALLAETVRRRGTLVADPGWIEVGLLLDEVTTGVRAAGLDCDPGYLRWLGVVVRFVYE